jgi:hypothetical protein
MTPVHSFHGVTGKQLAEPSDGDTLLLGTDERIRLLA